jgi:hypothetical protein
MANKTPGVLVGGERFFVDEPLYSENRKYWLLAQRDGNLVQYGYGIVPRSVFPGLVGKATHSADMQGDGNFGLYDAQGKPITVKMPDGRMATAFTHTGIDQPGNPFGNPGAFLVVQNDSNICLYDDPTTDQYSPNAIPIWALGYATPVETPTPGPVPPGAIVPITVDGKVLRRPDGSIFSFINHSQFLLLLRLLEGDEAGVRRDLLTLASFGMTVVRVFSRVPWNGDPGPGLFPERYPNYWATFRRLFVLAAECGLYVEIVALTEDLGVEGNADWVRRVMNETEPIVNAFREWSNEPPVNGIDIDALYAALQGELSAWARPWATGQYDPTCVPAGKYCTPHTDRATANTWDWVRKAKDTIEYREGGGPNNPTDPAMGRPIILDEPRGAASFKRDGGGARDNEPLKFYTYAALGQLLGAGGCAHGQAGLVGQLAQGLELECIKAFANGARTIGPNWQLGQYSRVGLTEFPVLADPTLRTYGMRVGADWMVVRCQIAGEWTLAPGWVSKDLDPYGIIRLVRPA